jgi:hypothetical protein
MIRVEVAKLIDGRKRTALCVGDEGQYGEENASTAGIVLSIAWG